MTTGHEKAREKVDATIQNLCKFCAQQFTITVHKKKNTFFEVFIILLYENKVVLTLWRETCRNNFGRAG